jgi:GT2 family glycosyltransferase/glycosyltransferase involved in cell wall biosynthesis
MNPKVFIIILHYGDREEIKECLDSLKFLDYDNFETFVVDNNEYNKGFAGGCNIGIKKAIEKDAKYVLLLNQDTVVEKDFLNRLVVEGEKNEKIGILSPVIYKYQTDKIHFNGGKINWLYTKGMHIEHATDFITGCCFLIKRQVIEKIGLMPEEYFLYFEDVEWCLKARRAGFECKIVSDAKIYHKVSSTAKKDSFVYVYYYFRNSLLMAKRNAPFLIRIIVYLKSFAFYFKQVIKLVVLPKKKFWSKVIMTAIKDFYRSKVGKYPGKKLIRIGIDGHELEKKHGAGAARHLREILKILVEMRDVRKNYKFVVYFKERIPSEWFLKDSIFETKILKFIKPSFAIFYNLLIPMAKIWDRINIFYFPSYMVPFLCLGKIIVTIHDVVYEAHPDWFRPMYRYAYRFLCRWGAKRATKIITISEFSKKEIVKYYKINSNKILISYPASNFNRITDLNEINLAKEKYGIKNDFIMFTAQIFNRRHVIESIKAFAKIVEGYPNLQFLIAGRNLTFPFQDLNQEIMELNRRQGREAIIYKQYIDTDKELAALMSAAKLFVYISSYEGFGIPPFEAAKCRTPIVLADTEVSREIFGDAAFYVRDYDNISEIAAVFKGAIEDSKKCLKIVEAGQQQVEKFTWDKASEVLYHAFRNQ